MKTKTDDTQLLAEAYESIYKKKNLLEEQYTKRIDTMENGVSGAEIIQTIRSTGKGKSIDPSATYFIEYEEMSEEVEDFDYDRETGYGRYTEPGEQIDFELSVFRGDEELQLGSEEYNDVLEYAKEIAYGLDYQ
jgi:hypothetical protein